MPGALTLVADIGGTNTRLALAHGAEVQPDSVRRHANASFPDLATVLQAYLTEAGSPELRGACAALAGPVQDGAGQMTNLDWDITEAGLSAALGGVPARLLNDLQAQGHALDRLAPGTLRPVFRPATPAPARVEATRLVIGIGTGFNAAAVHRTRNGRLVTASECGHITLPTPTAADRRLADFLARTAGFASVEEALSGRGLGQIDAWLTAETGGPPRRDAPGVIAALAEGEPRAQAAAETFVRLLGTVAGDLALVHLPFGGICLIGGMARAMTPHLARFGLADAFRAKGRFAPLMAGFPLAVVEDDYAALTGCAAFLAEDGA